ncbi:hypothetical protein SCHPADRAFT_927640, partial [Schizopora paradoxa]
MKDLMLRRDIWFAILDGVYMLLFVHKDCSVCMRRRHAYFKNASFFRPVQDAMLRWNNRFSRIRRVPHQPPAIPAKRPASDPRLLVSPTSSPQSSKLWSLGADLPETHKRRPISCLPSPSREAAQRGEPTLSSDPLDSADGLLFPRALRVADNSRANTGSPRGTLRRSLFS